MFANLYGDLMAGLQRTGVVMRDAFDSLYAQLTAWVEREHNEDGTHADVTADSIDVAGDIAAGGTIATEGEGNRLGSYQFNYGASSQVIKIGEEPNSWWFGTAQGGGIFAALSRTFNLWDSFNAPTTVPPNFPVVQVGYVSSPGVYYVMPGGGKRVRLGLVGSTSANRFERAVSDEYYELARTVAMGYWQTYAPVWSSAGVQPSMGDGTLSGRYTVVGNTVRFELKLTIGSTTGVGTGQYAFSLPTNALAAFTGQTSPLFNASFVDVSTGQFYNCQAYIASANTVVVFTDAQPGVAVTSTTPVGVGIGDVYLISGSYELV